MQFVQSDAAVSHSGVVPPQYALAVAVHCTHWLLEQTGVLPEQSPLMLQPPLGMHAPLAEQSPLRHTAAAFPLVQLPVPSA